MAETLTLAELERRLEAATGPDKELDCYICRVAKVCRFNINCADRCNMCVSYTTSLDAAIALVEEKLPGTGIVLETHRPKAVAGIGPHGKWPSEHNTPAIAILIALIRSLMQKEKGGR